MSRQGGGQQPKSLESLMMACADLSGPNKANSSFKGPALKDVKVARAQGPAYKPSAKARDWSSLSPNLEDAFGAPPPPQQQQQQNSLLVANQPLVTQDTETAGSPAQPNRGAAEVDDWGDFQAATPVLARNSAFQQPASAAPTPPQQPPPADDGDFSAFMAAAAPAPDAAVAVASQGQRDPQPLPAFQRLQPPFSFATVSPNLSNGLSNGDGGALADPHAVTSPSRPTQIEPKPARNAVVVITPPAQPQPQAPLQPAGGRYSNLRDIFERETEGTGNASSQPSSLQPTSTVSPPVGGDDDDDFGDFATAPGPPAGVSFPSLPATLPTFQGPPPEPSPNLTKPPSPPLSKAPTGGWFEADTKILTEKLSGYSSQFDSRPPAPSSATTEAAAADRGNFAANLLTDFATRDLPNPGVQSATLPPVPPDTSPASIPPAPPAVTLPGANSIFMPQPILAAGGGSGFVPWLQDRPPTPPPDLSNDPTDEDPAKLSDLCAFGDGEELDVAGVTQVGKEDQGNVQTFGAGESSTALDFNFASALATPAPCVNRGQDDPLAASTAGVESVSEASGHEREEKRKSSAASGASLQLSDDLSIAPAEPNADKYRSLYELAVVSPENSSPYAEWGRALRKVRDLLSEAAEALGRIKEREEVVAKEVRESERYQDYLVNLKELYRVHLRICWAYERREQKTLDMAERMGEVERAWSSLSLAVGLEAPSGDDAGGGDARAEGPSTCGLCLSPLVDSLAQEGMNAGTVEADGSVYHAACANLWANLVDRRLPGLNRNCEKHPQIQSN